MINFSEFYKKQKLILESVESYEKELNDVFGSKLTEEKYHISVDDAKRLFDILNKHIFGNKLKTIPIKVEDFTKEKHQNENGDYFIGRHVIEYDLNKPIEINGEKHFQYKNWILLVNTDLISFKGFIEILCHEMIHYYDLLYGFGQYGFESSYIERKLNGELDEDAYTGHGDYFDNMAKRIKNNFGINVQKEHEMNIDEFTKKYGKDSFMCESDNKEAIDFAKKLRRFVVDDGTNKIEVEGSKVRFIMM